MCSFFTRPWLLSLTLMFAAHGLGQITPSVPCENGFAGIYPCEQVDLMSHLVPSEIGGGEMNDVWGWTDPLDGHEYAILGRTSGTAFIDVTDPNNPVFLGDLPTHTLNSFWRDIKVHQDHAFIVSEASGHGMQVFDLTRLRNVPSPPVIFTEDAHYSGFGNCHNIAINETTGRAYAVGANTFSGGLNILDVSNPLSPNLIGSFAEDGYSHDAQVVNYIGPDPDHAQKELAFCFNEDAVTIVDVTDPSDAVLLSSTGYATSAYTHQGWLTEDHRFLLVGDELDEGSTNTRTYIFDVQDIDNPFLLGTHVGETTAIDHNLYIHEGLAFQSNYRAGLEILDLSNIEQGSLERVAFFDVYPANNAAQFNGSWSNYPFFPSGNVVVSHIEEGLFVVRPNIAPPCTESCGCTDPLACNFDADALNDDGTCDYGCYGCTDPTACNHDGQAIVDDGSCVYPDPQWGCDCSVSGTISTPLSGNQSSVPSTFEAVGNPEATSMEVVLNFNGQGSSWAGDIVLIVEDGLGNCVEFGGYNSTPGGCSSLGNYSTVWPANWATADNGTFTASVDLSSTGLSGEGTWSVTLYNGWSSSSQVNYDLTWTLFDACPNSDDPPILGCTDPQASNFNPLATEDDGSCFANDCPGDLDANGIINVNDVLTALGEFGCFGACTADLDDDGVVGVTDILTLLSSFGEPCPD